MRYLENVRFDTTPKVIDMRDDEEMDKPEAMEVEEKVLDEPEPKQISAKVTRI